MELTTIPVVTLRSIWYQHCGRLFALFTFLKNFHRNFANFVAPLTKETTKHVVHCKKNLVHWQMTETASKSIHKRRPYHSLNCCKNWRKDAVRNLAICRGTIWRRREKSQIVRTTELQFLPCATAPTIFWKIYFLYGFWSAKTCSFRAIFGLPVRILIICIGTSI